MNMILNKKFQSFNTYIGLKFFVNFNFHAIHPFNEQECIHSLDIFFPFYVCFYLLLFFNKKILCWWRFFLCFFPGWQVVNIYSLGLNSLHFRWVLFGFSSQYTMELKIDIAQFTSTFFFNCIFFGEKHIFSTPTNIGNQHIPS
jgi:hypothetical protein